MIHYIKKLNTTSPKPLPLAIEFIRFDPTASPALFCSFPFLCFGIGYHRCKSYENMESTGRVRILGVDDLTALKDRNILIVEVSAGRCATGFMLVDGFV